MFALHAALFVIGGICVGSFVTFAALRDAQVYRECVCPVARPPATPAPAVVSQSNLDVAALRAEWQAIHAPRHARAPEPAHSPSAVVKSAANCAVAVPEVGPESFLCGQVVQESIHMRVDEHNHERRPWTRQQHRFLMNQQKLSGPWLALYHSMRDGDMAFANMGVMHSSADFESNATYYCGLLPQNLLPWSVTFRNYEAWFNRTRGNPLLVDQLPPPRAPRYVANDIAIGVYTAGRFLRTRAGASLSTYLGRHPQHRVFLLTGEPDMLGLLNVVDVAHAGSDYNSAFHKQIHALKHMWTHANDAQWFYVIGCDTYFVEDYLLTSLDPYDASEPHILGCCAGDYDLAPIGKPGEKVWFGSGGAGIFLSRGLMAKLVPTLDNFVKNHWRDGVPAVDAATAYAAKLIGFDFGHIENMFATNPEQALKYHHTGVEIENAVWHFMHPTKMFDMDEFYIHQKIDRLARLPGVEGARQLLVTHQYRDKRRSYHHIRVLAAMLGEERTEDFRLSPQQLRHLESLRASKLPWWKSG